MYQEINLDKKYNPLSMTLHWLMFFGLAAAITMAWIMTEIDGITPYKVRIYNYHKWLGVSLFVLAVLRLFWRWIAKPPALPKAVSARNRAIAHIGHTALYGLMLSIPLLGYFYSLAAGYPVVWFGVIELPVLMAPNPLLKPILKEVHGLLANALMALVAGHALVALKHHFIEKNSVLSRMVPFLKAPHPNAFNSK